MLCSSGLSRFPNGRPYWIPTSRSAAASTRIAARGRLRRRRSATDEVGDLLRLDQDGVDAGSLEPDDVVTRGAAEVGDCELPGGDVWEQVEDAFEVVLVVLGVARGEQEDLRIDPLQRREDRFLVVHVGDDLQAERTGPLVQ